MLSLDHSSCSCNRVKKFTTAEKYYWKHGRMVRSLKLITLGLQVFEKVIYQVHIEIILLKGLCE